MIYYHLIWNKNEKLRRVLLNIIHPPKYYINKIILDEKSTLKSPIKRKNPLVIDEKASVDTVLENIIPSRDWVENGTHYKQSASLQPPRKDDVSDLMQMLDKKITARQARENGICVVREELFEQCFDELIR